MNGTERPSFTGRTAWARNLQTPLRNFLSTESSSAIVLLGAALAALAWANIDHSSYEISGAHDSRSGSATRDLAGLRQWSTTV